jgi:predicted unusual protein kinase regulating ubiquinone biosynthesis (AarF/ABC1/UbiB family)
MRTYRRQIFIEGFVPADPHPGNLFVQPPEGTEGWRLVFVDFGMVGRITPETKEGLRDIVIALGTRDLDRLIKGYQTIGALLPGAMDRLKEVQRAVFDRFWGRSMRELIEIKPREMRQFSAQFRDVMYEMPFQVPADLIFLGRCLGILSGMCTGLDPAFNRLRGIAPSPAPARRRGGDCSTRSRVVGGQRADAARCRRSTSLQRADLRPAADRHGQGRLRRWTAA